CRPCSVHGARDCHRSERYCFTRISSVAASEALRAQLSRRKSARRALFLDRDGTIIREKGFLSDPDGVETLPRVSAALRRAREAGYALVVVSNQSGVARGLFSEKSVHAVNDRVKRELEAGGVELDGMYYSPTHPRGAVDRYRTKDGTRKPSDKMFVQAARELNLDLRNSWVIGDRPSDFLSAWTIGASGALVRSGYGAEWEPKLAQFGPLKPHLIADDLSTAISIMLVERG
ncbi:MAG: D-glycero-alpha-D-manno-heptose-1,7-bisphosphate 7-phosphatase, partial [Candidatus Zixiibacteriota bacterium]